MKYNKKLQSVILVSIVLFVMFISGIVIFGKIGKTHPIDASKITSANIDFISGQRSLAKLDQIAWTSIVKKINAAEWRELSKENWPGENEILYKMIITMARDNVRDDEEYTLWCYHQKNKDFGGREHEYALTLTYEDAAGNTKAWSLPGKLYYEIRDEMNNLTGRKSGETSLEPMVNGLSTNLVSKTSPNGLFRAENYGTVNSITSAGLYPAEGIRMIEVASGKVLWNMTPGYYDCTFLWSSDGRYLSVSYTARTNGHTVIVDTTDFSEIYVPVPDEMQEKMREYRPDPYFMAVEWINDSQLSISFQWVGADNKTYSGTYVFDPLTGAIINLQIDDGSIPG